MGVGRQRELGVEPEDGYLDREIDREIDGDINRDINRDIDWDVDWDVERLVGVGHGPDPTLAPCPSRGPLRGRRTPSDWASR